MIHDLPKYEFERSVLKIIPEIPGVYIYFDKDGKIALQSLPSDIINKVQISDTKTKKEELTKQAASSNNASINLTIDEDKNKAGQQGAFACYVKG